MIVGRGRRPRLFGSCRGRRGFSLPELLVVVGILALLMSIILSPLRAARRQAQATRCGTQLQQLGVALENTVNEYKFYPVWDDGGSPKRYTWIDVLIQRGLISGPGVGYCPEDPQPAPINVARARQQRVYYPRKDSTPGIDYSYGIGVPLSSGGWAWRPGTAGNGDFRPRAFDGHERFPAQRLLAADANWSAIYNLSGDALITNSWSYPTQYDNTVGWRHQDYSANILFQDSHIGRVPYRVHDDPPINTMQVFVWYPGEPLHVGPDDQEAGNWYPNAPSVDWQGSGTGTTPREMAPSYYTQNLLWTRINHK
jgi:prepilin-type N-terminal cleavage/methylation domain-containing protein/prepilin-type processing-associated H-X9-DG protein